MNWITEQAAIGNRLVTRHGGTCQRTGFRAVVSLDGSMSEERALEFGYDDYAGAELKDGPGNDVMQFKQLLRTLCDMVDGSPPVLVHCHAGRSRSVTLVAAYLVLRHGMTRQQAYRHIAERREIGVMAGLEQLVDACRHGL